MGEGVPGGLTARALSIDAERAPGGDATPGLAAILARSVEGLFDRLGADLAAIYVVREGQRLFLSERPAPSPPGEHAALAREIGRLAASFETGLLEETSAASQESALARAALEHGLRSAAWAPLSDERGEPFGAVFVASREAARFGDASIRDLEAAAREIGWAARPAILLEEQEATRQLLEAEAELLAAVAEAQTEDQLVQGVVSGVQRALSADVALLFVEQSAGGTAWLCAAPAARVSEDDWAEARRAIASGSNTAMTERCRVEGAYQVRDLREVAETSVETWMRDRLGMASLLTATRSHNWGGLGLGIAALREHAGDWSESQRTFLARLARVLEISIERLRRGAVAAEHTLKLERQAGLLATGTELLEGLATNTNLEGACALIARRLRATFDADHVAIGLLELDAGTRTVLALDSDVMTREDYSSRLALDEAEEFGPMIGERRATCDADLAERSTVDQPTAIARGRGLRARLRAPFQLSDGRLGIVSVGSRSPGKWQQADADQLLALCRPVGVAIDRVLLLGQMAATSAALDAKTRILSTLVPGATLESAAQAVVREARELLGAVHSVVAVFPGGATQVSAISSDVLSSEEAAELMRGGLRRAGTWYDAISAGRPILLGNLATVERSPGEERLFQAGLRTIMGAPVVDSAGNIRGLLTAGSREAFRWDEGDLATLHELSRSLGLVCEQADLRRANQQREEKIRVLTRLLSALNPQTEPSEVAQSFAAQVREYLGVDVVMVYGFDHESGQRVRVALDARDAVVPRTPERVLLEDSNGYRGVLNEPAALFNSEARAAPAWLRDGARAMGCESAACVRLEAAGDAVGMIAAGSSRPDGVGRDELEILKALAAPLGMVLERARATSSIRQQTQRTQAVLDILTALGPAESLVEVAGPVATALRSMYDADHCGIGSIEDGTMTLVGLDSAVATWQIGDQAPVDVFLGNVPLESPVVHLVQDLDDDTGAPGDPDVFHMGGLRSSVRVLIGPAEDPLGVVTLGSFQTGRFRERDAQQLSQIVQPLAVAARYFRSKKESEQRTQRLETTNRILTRLSAGGTPEHLARGFLAESRLLFGSTHALAVQFDHEGGRGRLLAEDSDLEVAGLPTDFLLEEMHSAALVLQPTPQLVADMREAPAMNERHRHLIEAGVYSAIRAPLVVHDTVRGAVSLWGEGANRFTREDADLLGTLTRPLALALEKASALESLGESELKYRSLVAQADEMIFLFEPVTLRLLDANSFTSRALGYSQPQLAQLTLDRVIDATAEEIARNVEGVIASGELHLTDARFLRVDGSAIDVDAVASMVTYGGREAVLVLARDVSERKALLRQLMQSQKMDSLGAMAGAVAHDFNNLLTTILGFAGLLKRSQNMDTEERENLALIEDAARRAADLTGRLLSFSRGGLVRFGRVDLRNVVEDTLQLAEPTMHAGLEVRREFSGAPVYVEGDAGQLQQALTNIVLNARDAMPESGTISVGLRTEGGMAIVRIEDTGPGMDEETRVRIFEPFYTTKPAGSGTGLGMAITYGIVQGHHGDISVESEPGRGTAFTISLPLLDVADDEAPVDLFNAGEGNLVLVVDDDAMVRRTTTATLTELGYNVVEAPGGATAVEIVKARPDRFSAVLLDLVMPGMTGSETFRALMAVRPDLPVVVCTGYAADSHIDTDVKRRIAGLVQKPFTAERLGKALTAAGAMPTRASRI